MLIFRWGVRRRWNRVRLLLCARIEEQADL